MEPASPEQAPEQTTERPAEQTSAPAGQPAGARRDPVLIALLLVAAVYIFWDANRSFGLVDECWYAEIAETMVESGDWVTPRFGPSPDFIKPPLYYWTSLPFLASMPTPRFAMRVVPGLAMLVLILALSRLTRDRFGLGAARLAAVSFFLVYDHLQLHVYRSGVMDALVVLQIAIVFWCTLELPRRPGLLRVIGAVCGLAFLTKTVIVVIPLAIAVVGIWLQRRRARPTLSMVAQSVGAAVLVTVPWLVIAIHRNGDVVLDQMFVQQALKRATGDEEVFSGVRQPGRRELLYPWQHIMIYGLPWTLLLGPALAKAGVAALSGAESAERRAAATLAAAWIVIVMAIFTISRGVWGWYTASIYFPLALLVGWLLDDMIAGRERPWLTGLVAAMASASLFLLPNAFQFNAYADAAANVPLGWARGPAMGLGVLFFILVFRAARSAPAEDPLRTPWRLIVAAALVAIPYAVTVATLLAAQGSALPAWLLPAAAVAVAATVIGLGAVAARAEDPQRGRRRAIAGVLFVVAAVYVLAPLRFSLRKNGRFDHAIVAWHQSTLDAGDPVVFETYIYRYVVLYHLYGDELDITYDEETRLLTMQRKR